MKKIHFFVLSVFLFLASLKEGEARIYFIHIPKTGGTTLRLLLELQLSAQEIYPLRNDLKLGEAVNHELVSGHFPYSYCKKIDRNFEQAFKVTILRDPVERYLSFLRAKKKADVDLPDLESVLKLRLLPKNKFGDGLIDNALCRHLASNPTLQGEALLESAKNSLREMDCVILFENFSEEVIALFQRFNIQIEADQIPRINITQKEMVKEPLLEEVRQLNEWDIQLYEYAKTSLSQKKTIYPLRTESYQKILKKTDAVNYTFDQPLNGYGWTYRENEYNIDASLPVYRWVMDHPAHLFFLLEKGTDYLLHFNARPLTSEVFPKIRINGCELEVHQINQEPFSLYCAKIPKDLITDNPTEISFYASKAFQYRDIYPSRYNRNHPPLSFAVSRIILRPVNFCEFSSASFSPQCSAQSR